MSEGNGQATAVRSYDKWARDSVTRVFADRDAVPPGTWIWALAGVGSAVVYALLEVARAIRDHSAA